MRVDITQTVWGFRVALNSPGTERLACAVESLKTAIPKRCRRYQPAGRYWFIDKRAEPKLRRWLCTLGRELVDVDVFEQREAA
jgi:hypothetical protein